MLNLDRLDFGGFGWRKQEVNRNTNFFGYAYDGC